MRSHECAYLLSARLFARRCVMECEATSPARRYGAKNIAQRLPTQWILSLFTLSNRDLILDQACDDMWIHITSLVQNKISFLILITVKYVHTYSLEHILMKGFEVLYFLAMPQKQSKLYLAKQIEALPRVGIVIFFFSTSFQHLA